MPSAACRGRSAGAFAPSWQRPPQQRQVVRGPAAAGQAGVGQRQRWGVCAGLKSSRQCTRAVVDRSRVRALSGSSATHTSPPPAHRQGRGRPAQLAALQHQRAPASGEEQRQDLAWQTFVCVCTMALQSRVPDACMAQAGRHCRDEQLSSPQPTHPLPRLTASSWWSMSS